MPSSVVASIHYDLASGNLRIFYQSGAIYDYIDVPPEVYKERKAALSKGTFLNLQIKGKYAYQKVA